MTKTCGDYGGTKSNGEPCGRKSGWGTDSSKGKCKLHKEEEWNCELPLAETEFKGSQEIQDIKKRFLEVYSGKVITMEKAARKAGRDASQIWRWRQKDPEFDTMVQSAKRLQSEKRVDKVEDSLFKRIIEGDAAASETIFWLKNQDPSGWSDVQEHHHKGDGLSLNLNKTVVSREEVEKEE